MSEATPPPTAPMGSPRAISKSGITEETRARIAAELETEVKRRDEWYGLDNWTYREVVDFIADHIPRGTWTWG